jgi:hypothetical protein
VLIALQTYAVGLVLRNLLDPARGWHFSFAELRQQMLDSFQWFGTVFAGAYVALYTRFASQWAYLASLYNQIKSAECKPAGNQQALAEWKAAFIEDAFELHLANKHQFKSIIREWSRDEQVNAALDVSYRDRVVAMCKRSSIRSPAAAELPLPFDAAE